MRLADKESIGATAAQIVMAAGAAGGLGPVRALAQAVLTAPVLASAAKESEFRAGLRADLRIRPYWLLHEAQRTLRRS
jgi:hypothetical protein